MIDQYSARSSADRGRTGATTIRFGRARAGSGLGALLLLEACVGIVPATCRADRLRRRN